MKIAVVGCGALGSYYGARLLRQGREVSFLLRSDYDIVRRHGVQVQSPTGDFRVHPRCARTPQEIGPADLVLIGLKTTANHLFPELLPPLVSDHTAIITLQNGLGNEEALARLFPSGQILGGLCFVCLNRAAPGLIRHIAHGKIVLGEYLRSPQPRTYKLAALFEQAQVPCQVTSNLEQAHWEKLVWNIPFNGLGVAASASWKDYLEAPIDQIQVKGSCLSTDQLLSDPRGRKLVFALMHEVIDTARALGLLIPHSLADFQVQQTGRMGAYKPSTLIDFERGFPLELENLFLIPLQRARSGGIPVPHLERLCQVLTKLNPDGGTDEFLPRRA
jgi:2-dehydropantoate 2-reductase